MASVRFLPGPIWSSRCSRAARSSNRRVFAGWPKAARKSRTTLLMLRRGGDVFPELCGGLLSTNPYAKTGVSSCSLGGCLSRQSTMGEAIFHDDAIAWRLPEKHLMLHRTSMDLFPWCGCDMGHFDTVMLWADQPRRALQGSKFLDLVKGPSIYIPIIHTQADMGALREPIQRLKVRRLAGQPGNAT